MARDRYPDVVIVVPLPVVAAILYGGLMHYRRRLRRATEAAKSALGLGYSRDAVTEFLLHHYRLPPVAVIRAISTAGALSPADARAIVLPHLTKSQRDALKGVPPARFERQLDRFYPA